MSRADLAGLICAAALVAGTAGVPAAAAGSPPGKDEPSPSQLALEGIDRLMKALGLFIDSIPQYEAPVINEDGDIIIRRKRDRGPLPPPGGDDGAPLPGGSDTTRI